MKERIFKKKIKKRVFSVALALAMVVGLLPINSLTTYAQGQGSPCNICLNCGMGSWTHNNFIYNNSCTDCVPCVLDEGHSGSHSTTPGGSGAGDPGAGGSGSPKPGDMCGECGHSFEHHEFDSIEGVETVSLCDECSPINTPCVDKTWDECMSGGSGGSGGGTEWTEVVIGTDTVWYQSPADFTTNPEYQSLYCATDNAQYIYYTGEGFGNKQTCPHIRTTDPTSTPTHEHGNFATEWSSNDAGHWHACGNADCDVTESNVSSHTADGFAYAAHSFGYSAQDNVLTAACECGKSVSLTLSASSANYSGVTGLDDFNTATENSISVNDVVFYKVTTEGATTGGTKVNKPTATDYGYYYASLTVGTATAVKAFTIVQPHVHSFSEDEYGYNEIYHWKKCTATGASDACINAGGSGITYHAGDAATFVSAQKCATCGYEMRPKEEYVDYTTLSVGDRVAQGTCVGSAEALYMFYNMSEGKCFFSTNGGEVSGFNCYPCGFGGGIYGTSMAMDYTIVRDPRLGEISTDAGNGSIIDSYIGTETTPVTKIYDMDIENDIPLTDVEKAKVQAGNNFVVGLIVFDIEAKEDFSAAFETVATESGLTIGKYIDISMVLTCDTVGSRAITKTNNEVTLSVKLPAEMIDANANRTYYVIRDHEGEKAILPAAYNEETGIIYFSSNLFSTYAIAYIDREENNEIIPPAEGKDPVEEEPVKEIVTIPVYRVYNPNSGLHFYTVSEFEKDYLVSLGWNEEGIDFYAPEYGAAVYRAYNPANGDHYFTTSKAEIDALVANGWNDEGLAWYSDGELSVYKVKNPNAKKGQYFYTSNKKEYEYLVSLGWEDLGVAWKSMLTW